MIPSTPTPTRHKVSIVTFFCPVSWPIYLRLARRGADKKFFHGLWLGKKKGYYQGPYQGPPVMAPPQYAQPPPRRQPSFLEGWYARPGPQALCLLSLFFFSLVVGSSLFVPPYCICYLQSRCALLLLLDRRVLLRPLHHLRQLGSQSAALLRVQERLQLRIEERRVHSPRYICTYACSDCLYHQFPCMY